MKNVQQKLTQQLLERMKSGSLPWRDQWAKTGSPSLPMNWSTKDSYSGVNIIILWMAMEERGYEHNAWLTYNQARAFGGQVRKNERSTTCMFYKTVEKESANETGKVEASTYAMARYFPVFNLDQIDGLEDRPDSGPVDSYIEPLIPETVQGTLEAYCNRTGVTLVRGGNRCYYQSSTDTINLVRQFRDGNAFAGVAFHEMIHSTGHPSRLARKRFSNSPGDEEDQAFEEMVAELGAAFACAEIGVQGRYDEHASYLQSWMKALDNDERFFFRAAAAASKAHRFIFETERCESAA